MFTEQSIFTMKDYGRIRIHLKEIMDKNSITRTALARSIDTRYEVINKWYNGEVERVDLDILARICFVLNCKIADILVYEKTE